MNNVNDILAFVHWYMDTHYIIATLCTPALTFFYASFHGNVAWAFASGFMYFVYCAMKTP